MPIVDDNNVCTVDGCNSISGPTHSPDVTIVPNDDNACTNDYCDVSGIAHHVAVSGIDDNNLCTDDRCDPLTGIIIHLPIAGISDNDPCTIDNCNSSTGITVHILNSPTATAIVSAPILCYGGTACVMVSATGGATPYVAGSIGEFCGYSAGPPPITFDVEDANGCIVTTAPLLVIQPPKVIVTATSVCSGSSGTATAISGGGSGVFNYLWSPGGQTTNPVTGLSNGTYTVKVTDANGCSSTSLPVIVNCSTPVCARPGAIDGPEGACRNQNGVVYCIDAIPGATSYNWMIPTGAFVTGSSHGNCITLYFGNLYNGGSLCVQSVCPFGNSSYSCLNIPRITNLPSTPGIISGTSTLCPNTCVTYSVSSVNGATGYQWSVTGGLIITSGQGSGTVVVCSPSGFTGGSIKVYAKNCRGNSGTRTKNLTGKPGAPDWFSSNIVDNRSYGVCGGSTMAYEVGGLSGINVFIWTAPPGAIIYDRRGNSGNPLTVTGTDPVEGEWEVDIKFPIGFISGTVSVYGQNACGNGPTTSLFVQSKPNLPGPITGNASVCKHSTRCYSVSPVTGATSYTWTVNHGATIYSGQGSNSVCVKFNNASSTSVVITLNANNGCGSSATSSKTVSVNLGCKINAVGNDVEGTDKEISTALTAYPNPTTGKITVTFNSDNEVKYSLKVIDVIGRMLIGENISAAKGFNSVEINLVHFSSGMYFISIQTEGEELQTLRIIVE